MSTPLRRASTATAAVLLASALLLALLPAPGARAQAAPPSIAVEQGHGFATVSWDAVDGADAYEIERTPVDGDEPSAPGEVVGVWTADRYPYTGGQLTFADSGFALGERYRWRVRAVVDDTPGEWSAPVVDDTWDIAEPGALLTPFEASGGAELTSHEDEVAWLEALAAASERVRLETIGQTYQGRPVHLATVGLPAPGTREEIAASSAVLFTCTVHGGERAPREACMILLRQLALSDDPWVTRILSQTTVLVVPTLNPDGQVIAERTNSAGQDLNRDHILIRHPETFAVAEVIRDHRPELIMDAHELGRGADLAHLWPRSPNVGEGLFRLSQDHMTREHIFHREAETGWSARPWPTHRTDNWETLLNSVAGLKNALGQLQESPRIPDETRPAEEGQGTPANQRRRVYSHLWGLRAHLDYHHDNLPAITDAIAEAEAAHRANAGPIALDGARDNPIPPPIDEPTTMVLDPPPCGYRLSAAQYAQRDGSAPGDEVQWTSATVAERLEAHGVEVRPLGNGAVDVLLAQPLRAVIPYLFDPELESPVRPEGLPNISMAEGVRLADRSPTVVIAGVDTGVPNVVDDRGCSANDLLADELSWPSTGHFVQHVNRVVRELRVDGLIDGRQRAELTRAALHVGRPVRR